MHKDADGRYRAARRSRALLLPVAGITSPSNSPGCVGHRLGSRLAAYGQAFSTMILLEVDTEASPASNSNVMHHGPLTWTDSGWAQSLSGHGSQTPEGSSAPARSPRSTGRGDHDTLAKFDSSFAVRPFAHNSANALLRNVLITAQCKHNAYTLSTVCLQTRYCCHNQSASRSAASRVPADLAAARHGAQARRGRGQPRDLGGEPFRREIALLDRIAPPAFRQHAGIGELVLVQRVRQRHQDCGPADGRRARRPSRRRSARRRDAPPPCAPADRKRTARTRRARRAAHRLRARRRGPRRAPAARCAGARAAPARAARSPPARSPPSHARPGCRRTRASCSGRRPPARRKASAAAAITCGRTGLPVKVDLGLQRAGRDCSSVRKPVAIAVTRGASRRLARPMTPFCSCSTVGMPRMRRRHQRRHGRIAAEADHGGGPHAADQRPGLARCRASAAPRCAATRTDRGRAASRSE